ncbi:MerR family transcriptional regulator [Brevibacillus brevis]|uniref:MerR family transcriptional regulator n=1 Tax=Brevibacillus brevis TaxID=1393 RepID=A0ABY9TD53_BREBE|nr:MerR family transcriptional regulator [Brevibacillus brevis]WNC17913.1 MerR family transcriptional regulator [Brevibacillus brevis]
MVEGEKQHWKLNEFSKQIGKHYNTVDSWFKEMERKRIHYINRVESSGEKVYDSKDLEIGLFIKKKREEGWNLDPIFDSVAQEFEVRPFPAGSDNQLEVSDPAELRKVLLREFEQMAYRIAEQKASEAIRALPEPKSREEERQEKINDFITQSRILDQLEDEALALWYQKPETERVKKTGLFGLVKIEDVENRDKFVRDYIRKHKEERIRKEFGIKEN